MATDWETRHLQEAIREDTDVAVSATPAINTDKTNYADLGPLTLAVTSFTTNLTGDPKNGDQLVVRIEDDGAGPYALAWGNKFESVGATLPVITVDAKRHTLIFFYSTASAKWGLVYAAVEA